jgi:hypothetical protein
MECELTTLVVLGTDCTGSYRSNFHTITTMTALMWRLIELIVNQWNIPALVMYIFLKQFNFCSIFEAHNNIMWMLNISGNRNKATFIFNFFACGCYIFLQGRVMMFNITFNNISVISRWSVLLMEVIWENHQPVNFITYCCIEYTSPERDSNLQC